jgi:hypothetical protein
MSAGEMSRVALLIDADNLSPDGMQRAVEELDRLGLRATLRRAYGSHDTLGNVRDFLSAHSIRAIVNHGRGTTDAALVVDAMDLLYGDCLPGIVAIASSDADFAPLAVRLREAGRRVICFAHRKKAADGLDRVYDEVIHVDGPAPREAASAQAPVKAIKAPARARKSAPRKQPAPEPTLSDRVRAALHEFPGFARGEELELNAVVKKLKDEKLMSKNTSASKFFAANAPEVELRPARAPNKLRRVG